jgi:hypothetical protein
MPSPSRLTTTTPEFTPNYFDDDEDEEEEEDDEEDEDELLLLDRLLRLLIFFDFFPLIIKNKLLSLSTRFLLTRLRSKFGVSYLRALGLGHRLLLNLKSFTYGRPLRSSST